jgi:tRNA/tmRNA/rRNA uracil-C5-methylase (TrmA/RlmC/RlmD family)
MTELADLTPNEKVLEIGTGSGYQSAVLSRLAGEVYSIEIVPELARASAERLRQLGYQNVTVRKATAIAAGPSTRLSTRSSSRPPPTASRSRCSTSSRRAGAWSSRSAASSRS